MHFGLTDEQKLLQATLRDYAARELPAPRLRELFEHGGGWDDATWRGASTIGLPGLVVPEAYGGAGLELLDLALAFEVLGEAAVPGPFLGHALATLALVEAGSPRQRERWLPKLAAGEAIGSVALAENGEWVPAGWSARVDESALRGAKQHVEHADSADVLIVGLSEGELGLVERDAGGTTVSRLDGIDRMRSLSEVTFRDTPIELLPEGRAAAPRLFDAACTLLAADAFGAASKMIQMTVEFVLTREQFGTALAQFQGVKHQLANLAAEHEPMRGLFWYAGHAFDHLPAESEHAAAVAKAHVTERALAVGRAAIELHGGIGFTWECDVQFWMKRAMFAHTWLGTPRTHRKRIAALGNW